MLLLLLAAKLMLQPVGGLPPPGTKAAGCCGITDTGSDCDTQPKGAWNTTTFGIKSLAECARRCTNCSQCSYVSFNPAPNSEDCSWYNEASCDLGRLLHVEGYESEFVQPGRGPPPAPPVNVVVDWENVRIASTCTAATIEVDVMPFLSRDLWGGPFDGCERPLRYTDLLPPASPFPPRGSLPRCCSRVAAAVSFAATAFLSDYTALSNLGAEFVRFAPWSPDPRAVVLELSPSDCTNEKPATNFNSTVYDAITRDFMEAVW